MGSVPDFNNMYLFTCIYLYVAAAQFETTYEPVKEELVPGMILPKQQPITYPQRTFPVEEEMFDHQKSELITGLTS